MSFTPGGCLISAFPDGATIINLQGTPGASPAIDRNKGLHNVLDKAPDKYMHSYYSDQEFIRDHAVPDYWPEGLIQSYKMDHCIESPGAARIVVFHGHPKPHEIWDGWVKETWI